MPSANCKLVVWLGALDFLEPLIKGIGIQIGVGGSKVPALRTTGPQSISWYCWWKISQTTTGWDVFETLVNHGRFQLPTSLNWWVFPGFLVAINSTNQPSRRRPPTQGPEATPRYLVTKALTFRLSKGQALPLALTTVTRQAVWEDPWRLPSVNKNFRYLKWRHWTLRKPYPYSFYRWGCLHFRYLTFLVKVCDPQNLHVMNIREFFSIPDRWRSPWQPFKGHQQNCFWLLCVFFNAPDYFWFEVGRVRDVNCFFFRCVSFMFLPRIFIWRYLNRESWRFMKERRMCCVFFFSMRCADRILTTQ